LIQLDFFFGSFEKRERKSGITNEKYQSVLVFWTTGTGQKRQKTSENVRKKNAGSLIWIPPVNLPPVIQRKWTEEEEEDKDKDKDKERKKKDKRIPIRESGEWLSGVERRRQMEMARAGDQLERLYELESMSAGCQMSWILLN